ncbi:MAG: LysR family transcriptional regulator [Planctomycetota bacterium]
MDPAALLTFAEVARTGSFSAAARKSGRSRQSVNRQVAALEARLGLRLFERSTRRLRITDVGQRLLLHAERLRRDVLAATDEMRAARSAPGGTLRVTAPGLLGEEFVSPTIASFLSLYPEVRIEEVLSLERVDLLEQRFDLAIRAGRLEDSPLISRLLGHAVVVCCASPALLASAPPIEVPGDLLDLPTIHYGRHQIGPEVTWRFGDTAVRVLPRLASTSTRTACNAAVHGLGVVRLPLLACQAELESGALVEVLVAWRDETVPIQAVYASPSATNPTLQAFVGALLDAAQQATWLVR